MLSNETKKVEGMWSIAPTVEPTPQSTDLADTDETEEVCVRVSCRRTAVVVDDADGLSRLKKSDASSVASLVTSAGT